MSNAKWTSKDTGMLMGCAFAMLRVAVCLPMYLILVFALMQANDMPTWAWVLYWAYVPTTCVLRFGQAISESLMKA